MKAKIYVGAKKYALYIGRKIIPDGYTQLEYIESTGTQYIDTGVSGANITRFITKAFCSPRGITNTQLIGGISESATTFYGVRVSTTNPSVNGWYARNAEGNALVPYTVWATTDATIVSDSSQVGTITNETTKENFNFVNFASSFNFLDTNLLVFGGHPNRITPNAKISYLKLYTSQGLVRDMIACKRNSDGVLGMYDTVSNTFFTNAGTGTFIGGEL